MWVEGAPRVACVTPARRVAGRSVTTLEGLEPAERRCWAEAFSAGVRKPGDLMLMYGSTLFFVQVLGAFRVHPKLWTTVGAEPGVHTVAAGMSTSGSLSPGW